MQNDSDIEFEVDKIIDNIKKIDKEDKCIYSYVDFFSK